MKSCDGNRGQQECACDCYAPAGMLVVVCAAVGYGVVCGVALTLIGQAVWRLL